MTYRDRRIVTVEPGQAFNAAEWENIAQEIETTVLTGPRKVGRDYSFSSYRVQGSWRGDRSGVQILPPHPEAAVAPAEMAEHPFILEFPTQEAGLWTLTNYRRLREHRNLTLLLNTLLRGPARGGSRLEPQAAPAVGCRLGPGYRGITDGAGGRPIWSGCVCINSLPKIRLLRLGDQLG
jgi:hypothetical protein